MYVVFFFHFLRTTIRKLSWDDNPGKKDSGAELRCSSSLEVDGILSDVVSVEDLEVEQRSR